VAGQADRQTVEDLLRRVGAEMPLRAQQAGPAEQRLGPADHLIAILALPDLARLLRRERAPAEWAVDVSSFPLPARAGPESWCRSSSRYGQHPVVNGERPHRLIVQVWVVVESVAPLRLPQALLPSG
jgi:hypothetical protein